MKKYKISILFSALILLVCLIVMVSAVWGWFVLNVGGSAVGGFVVEVTEAKTSLEFIVEGVPHEGENLVLAEAYPGKVYNFILRITNITQKNLSLSGAYIDPVYSLVDGGVPPNITKVFVTALSDISILTKVSETETKFAYKIDISQKPTEWTLFNSLKLFDTKDYLLQRTGSPTATTLLLAPGEVLQISYKLHFSETLETFEFRNSCQNMKFKLTKLIVKSEIANG